MSTTVPPTLKSIAHYVKIANENASRDPVVYYWCLYYAVQTGMKIDRTSKDALNFLTSLLGTLEAVKKQLASTEAIINEVMAQVHLENYATKVFNYADGREKTGDVDKAVAHAFYTAGHVLDVLGLFSEVDDGIASMRKYAKWKSTQIFQSLKTGTPYVPSNPQTSPGAGAGADLDFGLPAPPTALGGGAGISPTPAMHNPADYGISAGYGTSDGYGSSRGYSTTGTSTNTYGIQDQYNQYNNSMPYPNQPPQQILPPPVVPPREHQYDPFAARGLSEALPEAAPRRPPGPMAPPAAPKASPTLDDFNECKRFTKYALSAIDYEDIPTIRDNLIKALAIVDKFA